jgi:3-deoxy-manno-octulosonate cytidylyltransferase (CMP-KDO synthetase)
MGKVLAVIPARYGSSRLPGKPLRPIDGKPMVRRVYEAAEATRLFDAIVVATDDRRVFDAVKSFGGDARMTRPDHASGSDRVAEVAASSDAEIVVNVQGDLPFLSRALVGPMVTAMLEDPSIPMATVSVPIREAEAWRSPNVVKVVTDEAGFALYFSRAPIPARRDAVASGAAVLGHQHVGLYAYRRDFLMRFASWPPSRLEKIERLEQLRVLERGERIFVAEVSEQVIEVDTPEDLERAEALAVSRGGREEGVGQP